jgi:hypothetical protein
MEMAYTSIAVFSAIVLFIGALKFLKWAWLTPKKLEKMLKDQGLKGNPYKFLFGDFKELKNMAMEAKSKPMNLYDDDLPPRVLPIFDKIIKKFGNSCKDLFLFLILQF